MGDDDDVYNVKGKLELKDFDVTKTLAKIKEAERVPESMVLLKDGTMLKASKLSTDLEGFIGETGQMKKIEADGNGFKDKTDELKSDKTRLLEKLGLSEANFKFPIWLIVVIAVAGVGLIVLCIISFRFVCNNSSRTK